VQGQNARSESKEVITVLVKPSAKEHGRRILLMGATLFSIMVIISLDGTQRAPTVQDAPSLGFGRLIFKDKALCQYCHNWHASGFQGYPGDALSLRLTRLTDKEFAEVVKCGRPGTAMPYYDALAYTDTRCYGRTREEMGKDMPPTGFKFLSEREVDALVNYLFTNVVGRGPATYEDCIDFWGQDSLQCDPMKRGNASP